VASIASSLRWSATERRQPRCTFGTGGIVTRASRPRHRRRSTWR
jgi:hypothetical protein